MPIALEFVSLIVPLKAIHRNYRGGFESFARKYADVGSYLQDDHLARIGCMSTADGMSILEALAEAGLRVEEDPQTSEVAMVLRCATPIPECRWLVIGESGSSEACWFEGDQSGPLVRVRDCPMYLCPRPSFENLPRTFRDAGVSIGPGEGPEGDRFVCRREGVEVVLEVLRDAAGQDDPILILIPRGGRIAGAPDDAGLIGAIDRLLVGLGSKKGPDEPAY